MPPISIAKHDQASLSNVSERLDTISQTIRMVVETMQRYDIPLIEVKYQKELVRGMKGVMNFSNAASIAVQEALDGDHRFVASAEQLQKKVSQLEADLEAAQRRIADLESKA